MNEGPLRKLIFVLLVLCCAGLVLQIATRTHHYQWDFKVYYYAAKAYAAGQDPYDTGVLSRIAGTPIGLPYTYPPATLLVFRPFSSTGYTAAFYGFLSLKCILLLGLVYLWKSKFLTAEKDWLFYPFCLFAFNCAIYLDMRAGNITVVEQMAVWLAFFFHLKRRPALFCLLVLAGAAFRITPLFFLVALLFSTGKKRVVYFFSSSLLALSALALSYAGSPVLFSSFMNTSAGLDERGTANPSTLPLIRDVLQWLAAKTGTGVAPGLDLVLYSVIVSVILLVTWRACTRLRSTDTDDRERVELFLLCLVYALVLPRFKDYSYMMLIVPTYFLLRRVRSTKAYPLLFFAAVLPSRLLSSQVFRTDLGILWEYHPLVVAYCVWGMYVYEILARKAVRGTRGP